MTQAEIQNFLLKQNPEFYFSSEKIVEMLKLPKENTSSENISRMRKYGEIETVKVRVAGNHIIQHCHRLTKRGRGR